MVGSTATNAPGGARRLVGRISPLEWIAAAACAVVFVVLVALEPDILEAPFASTRAKVFTFGGTALAAVLLVVMVGAKVPPVIRLLVLGVPLVAVSWWLISPYFIDDVVHDEFSTSIAAAEQEQALPPTPPTGPTTSAPGPVLLGAGEFVGLAGHEGTGDAGVFRVAGGTQVLRFENFDIENGPDLELYVVPGRDRRDLAGATHLGALRGNVGDQTYELTEPLAPGDWTVLVWCEAFSVEFVAASLTVT
jgi:hypothetical protein